MFRRWTARIVLAFLTLEVGLIFSLYTKEIPALRRAEEGIFQSCLSWVRTTDPKEAILETDQETGHWSLRPLRRDGQETFARDWSLISVPQAAELFDGQEATPAEYAVMLAQLHQAGVRDLVLTTELSWEAAPEIELVALDSALRPFEGVLLPLNFSEVPEPLAYPEWLQHSVIPKANFIGDASSLPIMNQVVSPPSVTGDAGVCFAFPDFGSRNDQVRAPERLPLLARWGEDFLASWPLQVAMRAEGVSPEELEVRSGIHLRIGRDGPVIPIDDFGRARVASIAVGSEGLEFLSAKSLFPLDGTELPELKRKAVLVDVRDGKAEGQSLTLLQEARALLSLARPGPAETFERLSLGWEVVLYLEIVLVGIFALYLRPFPQLIALAVLCVGLFVFVVGLLNWKGLWTPLLPLVAATVMAWCLVGYLQQIAHPVVKRKKKNPPAAKAPDAAPGPG